MIEVLLVIKRLVVIALCMGFVLVEQTISWADPVRASEYNEAGVQATKTGDVLEALNQFQRAYARDPGNETIFSNLLVAYLNVAGHYEKQGQYQTAISHAQTALGYAPNDQRVLRTLALLRHNWAVQLAESKSHQLADQQFTQALEIARRGGINDVAHNISQTNARNLSMWAKRLNDEGQIRFAERLLSQALDLDPQCGPAYLEMGQIAYQQRNYDVALANLDIAYQLIPDTPGLGAFADKVRREAAVEEGFQKRDVGRFQVYFESGNTNQQLANQVLEILRRAQIYVGQRLKAYPTKPIQVVLYNDEQFSAVTNAPHWTLAAYDGRIRVRTETLRAGRADLEDALFHEYTHALIAQICERPIPAWLNEGLAQLFEPNDPVSIHDQRRLAALDRQDEIVLFSALPMTTFIEIQDARMAGQVYLQSKMFISWLSKRYGTYRLRNVLDFMNGGQTVEEAFQNSYPHGLDQLQALWERSLLNS